MNVHSNQPLSKPLRTQLENTVKAAREVAEKAALAALEQLAVGEGRAPDYLSDDKKALRRRLRAHGRALGDVKATDDTQGLQRLVWEVAYEHWHRMLFARFLAENGLLMWEVGAAVSLDDCEALAQEADPSMNLGAKTKWELAGKLAARMLPQVFKPQSPVFELALAPEYQRELERLLAGLAHDVFQASDSLGWVYQFWQAKRKDEVNAMEVKIGAEELPAVTQLFTEPYMVDFLLHNSLGAWWATRHPGQSCPVQLTYLRTLEDGTPAAGKFEGWPDSLKDFKLLDPCCGSGHFLVAAFLLLVPMRMADEGLTAMDAVDYVLQDNLHGLELDPRCVEIAVFALALAAWRYPDENGDPLGVRPDMPAPQIACCGLQLNASAQDWEALAAILISNQELVAQDLRGLQAHFSQSPLLGSLLDPTRVFQNDLATTDIHTLRQLVAQALASEAPASQAHAATTGAGDEHPGSALELALAARGLLDAARLLSARYHLVITNVPYLARGKQNDALKKYCETHYPDAKNDLANVFLERCLELAHPPQGSEGTGVVQIVMPQNWLFLTGFRKQRESLLERAYWNLVARLGAGAFETISGEVVQAILLTMTLVKESDELQMQCLDTSAYKAVADKATHLQKGGVITIRQSAQRSNPDARIVFGEQAAGKPLSDYATSSVGIQTGDYSRFAVSFWEPGNFNRYVWEYYERPGELAVERTDVIRWEGGNGQLYKMVQEKLGENGTGAWLRGADCWGRRGVIVQLMQGLVSSPYIGYKYDQTLAVLKPKKDEHLLPILSFCSSPEYNEAVRQIDQALKVTNATLVKVPFDLAHWQQVAAERYPHGLPKPYSDDPTQWLFHGHPVPATDPLQVAVARLVGYRWPAEQEARSAQARAEFQAKSDSGAHTSSASSYQTQSENADWATTTAPAQGQGMELSDAAHSWIARCAALDAHTDDDGIVCLPSVRGETPAHERLLKLLIAAWESAEPGSWKPSVLDKLLADADCAGKGLDVWLCDKFFEQHTKRFHHRPFVWHVWDGLKDGFAALVNYHKLDTKNLERLIHTYLGDWIRQQETGVREGVDGAPIRLAAAQDLKRRLELILEGEPPYDIFVRWKSLAEQPIGWNPDLNDGVRLNIRPFMTAEVLRHNKKPKLNISWDKDRGKDVESAPWYPVFGGDRINDHHLTRSEKLSAKGSS